MLLKRNFLRAIYTQIPKRPFNSEIQSWHPTVITPQYVESSLKKCPTDMDTLKLFLWFARQRDYFHNHQSFNYMVPIVSRLTCRLESVDGVVKELKTDGRLIKAQTFLMLLRIYWHGKMYDMALETFEEMICYGYTGNTFARNIVLDVLFKIGNVDKAVEFFNEMENRNFLTYNTVLCHLYNLNHLLGVCWVMRLMVREKFRPNSGSFFMVLDCLCKGGRMVETLQVLGLMIISGMSIEVNVWSILIDGFCRDGRIEIASELLEKMVKAGHAPNIVTYTFLIKELMRCRMFDRVRGVLLIMESTGCLPDVFLYNILIDGMPNLKHCNDACLALPEREMEHYSGIIPSYFIKSGHLPGAVDIYNDMLNRGLKPDGYSFAGLLSALCSDGKIDYAKNVYRGLVLKNLCFDAHITTVMTDELIKVGRCQDAITLFKEAIAKKLPLDVVSYTVCIKGLIKDCRLEEVYNMYYQMKERGVFPNTCTCNYMLHSFCTGRDIELIKWLVREMVETGIKPNYGTHRIITSFLKRSCRVCSKRNFQNMRKNCRCVSLVDYINKAGELGEVFMPLLRYYSEFLLFIESTDSEEIPEVAASFG